MQRGFCLTQYGERWLVPRSRRYYPQQRASTIDSADALTSLQAYRQHEVDPDVADRLRHPIWLVPHRNVPHGHVGQRHGKPRQAFLDRISEWLLKVEKV